MSIEQLMGRYFRLQQELAIACAASPWNSRRIDRLSQELAATEREIGQREPARPNAAAVASA
ncbi:MAG: hypothetical protein V4844_04930 [Pseudomonadota bacterium]|jgi:hypothetical protein